MLAAVLVVAVGCASGPSRSAGAPVSLSPPTCLPGATASLSMEMGVYEVSCGRRKGMGEDESVGELDMGGDGPSFLTGSSP